MLQKISGLVFIMFLTIVPLFLLLSGSYRPMYKALSAKNDKLSKLESAMAEGFPGSQELLKMRVSINYLGGNKEQNGVLLGENMLMKDVRPAQSDIIDSNTQAILDIAKRSGRPSYLMLIPTACAIQQEKVPYNNITPLYSQRQLTDDVFRKMSGNVTAIDVYPTLFNHQVEYLYYRTDSMPTGIGGYYIYTVAAKKLGFSNPYGIEQFDVEHIDYNYRGDLYELSPFRTITPDRVSTYIFSQRQRSYTVTHYNQNEMRRYFTLYPKFRTLIDGSMGVILGGVSPIVDIEIGNPQYNRQLLVMGDRSMQSYLPFLLTHYKRVTFLDTKNMTPELIERINPQDYSQILFAYSVENFISEKQLSAISSFGK